MLFNNSVKQLTGIWYRYKSPCKMERVSTWADLW